MSLYELLGVVQDATAQDIKRAYFRLVRQFSPEKEPQTFMRIREAYETLSNADKRNTYDISLARYAGASEEVRGLIMKADNLKERGLLRDAIQLLEGSEYSGYGDVAIALCYFYLESEKRGKAINLVKELLKSDPDNVRYLRLAVLVYIKRGWFNKANDFSKNLERLDPGNEENVLPFHTDDDDDMVDDITAIVNDIERIQAIGKKAPLLCCHVLECICNYEFDKYDLSFALIDKRWYDPIFVAEKLAAHTEGFPVERSGKINSKINGILEIILKENLYSIVPFIEQTIKNTKLEALFYTDDYKIAKSGYMAWNAAQNCGIAKEVVLVSLMSVWSQISLFSDDNLEDYKNELITAELDVLDNYCKYISHIERLRNEHRDLYDGAGAFFDMVRDNVDRVIKKEFYRRVTMAMKIKTRIVLEWLGKSDDDKSIKKKGGVPVSVTKIGRNEMCPCGSGKKYKKCCGR